MQLLETVDSAVTAAAVIADRTPQTLSDTAKRLYTALIATAVETSKARGYSPGTTHVTLHLPLEVLADVCGMHRVTAWRHLPALKELGLIDYRAHKGTLRGETRNTGMLWQVRLNPLAGSKARLSYDDLKHKWRDLDKDVRRKRTAYRTLKDRVQQSDKTPLAELEIVRLTYWTLKPDTNQTPLLRSDSCTPKNAVLEALLDVTAAKPGRDTVQRVDTAARSLAVALADHGSTDFYRLLVWRCLRLSQQGTDLFQVVYQMAIRARVDVSEGFARKGGALFVSRLKKTDFWDELMRC